MPQLLFRNTVVVEKPKHAFNHGAVEEIVAGVARVAALGIDRLEFSQGQALQAVVRASKPNRFVGIALVIVFPWGG